MPVHLDQPCRPGLPKSQGVGQSALAVDVPTLLLVRQGPVQAEVEAVALVDDELRIVAHMLAAKRKRGLHFDGVRAGNPPYHVAVLEDPGDL